MHIIAGYWFCSLRKAWLLATRQDVALHQGSFFRALLQRSIAEHDMLTVDRGGHLRREFAEWMLQADRTVRAPGMAVQQQRFSWEIGGQLAGPRPQSSAPPPDDEGWQQVKPRKAARPRTKAAFASNAKSRSLRTEGGRQRLHAGNLQSSRGVCTRHHGLQPRHCSLQPRRWPESQTHQGTKKL